ncbi:847_t:CDS:2 [Acaulospora morrowiae]|uniref:847_t:CDS:1 n=1 Tax=Acaulospora morrowiae TaxID=94023 RepID=A0A9N9F0S5_9GLOM|nr:847_t:CDS:2 [Acaulospora morrowiae]
MSDILKEANHWLDLDFTSPVAKLKRIKTYAYSCLEQKVQNTTSIMRITDFSASNGWLEKFKKYNNLKSQIRLGKVKEAAKLDLISICNDL